MKFFVFLTLCFFAAHCGPKKSASQVDTSVFFESKNKQFRAKLGFNEKLKALELLDGELQFENTNASPITSLEVEYFVPTMPSMGHGTDNSNLTYATNPQMPDRVAVKGVWFNMGGPWEISVAAKVNGTSDVVTLKIEVP